MAGRFSVEAVFRAVDRVTAPVSRMQQRVGRFTRSMARGLRNADRFARRLSGTLARSLRRGAVIAGVAIGATALALNAFAEDADALAKQSRRLDFDIEALQEWRFVAEQSGIEAAAFTKSLGDMSVRLGEARAGSGALVTFLNRTDRALLRQLNTTKSAADAMDVLMGAIADIEDPMRQAALANAAFGRQGRFMVNIAQEGADGIERLREQARRHGLTTMEMAVAAEEFNDSTNASKRALAGMRNAALAPLLPVLTKLSDRTEAWSVANRELVADKVQRGFTFIVENFQDIVKWAKRVGVALVSFWALVAVLRTLVLVMTAVNLVMAANPIVLIVLAIAALVGGIVLLVKHWDRASAVAERFAGVVEDRFNALPGPVKAALRLIHAPIIGLIRVASWLIQNWRAVPGMLTSFWEAIPGPVKLAVDLILAPVRLLVDSASWLIQNWEGVSGFFADLWGGIVDSFRTRVDQIMALVDKVRGAARFVQRTATFGLFGRETDEERAGSAGDRAAVVGPQARAARTVSEERRETSSTAELLIRDETGRAEIRNRRGEFPGVGFRLDRTGAFE